MRKISKPKIINDKSISELELDFNQPVDQKLLLSSSTWRADRGINDLGF